MGVVAAQGGVCRKFLTTKLMVAIFQIRLDRIIIELIDENRGEVSIFKSCLLYTSPSPRDRG